MYYSYFIGKYLICSFEPDQESSKNQSLFPQDVQKLPPKASFTPQERQ